MSDTLRDQIRRNLSQKETDELVEIWQTNDRAAWADMTFDIIREILQERQAELPVQNEPITELSEPDEEAEEGPETAALPAHSTIIQIVSIELQMVLNYE